MHADSSHSSRFRKRQRVPLTAHVNIRRAGVHGFRVRIYDASPEGCKIEFVERPALGERLWVKFDGLEAIEATVCWLDGHIGGVHFEKQMHDAVFKHVASPGPGAQP